MRKWMGIGMAAMLLVGCSQSSVNQETTAPEVTTEAVTTEAETQTPEATTEGKEMMDWEKMELTMDYQQDMDTVQRSLLSTGNGGRMQAMLAKAQKGEPITVGFIGGSITFGYTVKKTECFATLYCQWLEKVLGTQVNCLNAGISGTPSVLGNLRVDEEVLAQKPDMVVVEFAVNDGGETTYKNSYESLLNRILKAENDPAVMLLFTITEEGHSCENWMSQIGEHYQLPMVSVVQSMMADCKAGKITYKDYSKDGVHPNPVGHQWITEYLAYATAQIAAEEAQPAYELPKRAAVANYYENLVFHTRANTTPKAVGDWADCTSMTNFSQTFAQGWKYVPGGDNQPLTFTENFRIAMMIYHDVPTSDKKFGAVDVYIDGEKVRTIQAASASGWHEPHFCVLLEEVDLKEHTIEIKAAEGSEDKEFEIMGIAWM